MLPHEGMWSIVLLVFLSITCESEALTGGAFGNSRKQHGDHLQRQAALRGNAPAKHRRSVVALQVGLKTTRRTVSAASRRSEQNQTNMHQSDSNNEEDTGLCRKKFKWIAKIQKKCRKAFGDDSVWDRSAHDGKCMSAWNKCWTGFYSICCQQPKGPQDVGAYCDKRREQHREKGDTSGQDDDQACQVEAEFKEVNKIGKQIRKAIKQLDEPAAIKEPRQEIIISNAPIQETLGNRKSDSIQLKPGAPSSAAPSTAAPSTAAPSTAAPSTAAPSTAAPQTVAPTVAPPPAATTAAAPPPIATTAAPPPAATSAAPNAPPAAPGTTAAPEADDDDDDDDEDGNATAPVVTTQAPSSKKPVPAPLRAPVTNEKIIDSTPSETLTLETKCNSLNKLAAAAVQRIDKIKHFAEVHGAKKDKVPAAKIEPKIEPPVVPQLSLFSYGARLLETSPLGSTFNLGLLQSAARQSGIDEDAEEVVMDVDKEAKEVATAVEKVPVDKVDAEARDPDLYASMHGMLKLGQNLQTLVASGGFCNGKAAALEKTRVDDADDDDDDEGDEEADEEKGDSGKGKDSNSKKKSDGGDGKEGKGGGKEEDVDDDSRNSDDDSRNTAGDAKKADGPKTAEEKNGGKKRSQAIKVSGKDASDATDAADEDDDSDDEQKDNNANGVNNKPASKTSGKKSKKAADQGDGDDDDDEAQNGNARTADANDASPKKSSRRAAKKSKSQGISTESVTVDGPVTVNQVRVVELLQWENTLHVAVKDFDTKVHPHGYKWWRYRFEYTYIESIVLVVLIIITFFALLLFDGVRFFHAHRFHKTGNMHLLYRYPVTYFVFHGCVSMCVVFVAYVLFVPWGGASIFDWGAAHIREIVDGDTNVPFFGYSWYALVLDVQLQLFATYLLYTLFVAMVAHNYVGALAEWKLLSLPEEMRETPPQEDDKSVNHDLYYHLAHIIFKRVHASEELQLLFAEHKMRVPGVNTLPPGVVEDEHWKTFRIHLLLTEGLGTSLEHLVAVSVTTNVCLAVVAMTVGIFAIYFQVPFMYLLPPIVMFALLIFLLGYLTSRVKLFRKMSESLDMKTPLKYFSGHVYCRMVQVVMYCLFFSFARLLLSNDIYQYYPKVYLATVAGLVIFLVLMQLLAGDIIKETIISLIFPPHITNEELGKFLADINTWHYGFACHDCGVQQKPNDESMSKAWASIGGRNAFRGFQ